MALLVLLPNCWKMAGQTRQKRGDNFSSSDSLFLSLHYQENNELLNCGDSKAEVNKKKQLKWEEISSECTKSKYGAQNCGASAKTHEAYENVSKEASGIRNSIDKSFLILRRSRNIHMCTVNAANNPWHPRITQTVKILFRSV